MSIIIGLDAHSTYCEFAVYKDNRNLLECKRIETSEEKLINYVRRFTGTKVLIFEESTLSQWLYGIFLPYFDDIIIADPYRNYLIHKTDQKSDTEDPRKLVTLYFNNSLERVYHTDNDIVELKRLVLQYHSFNKHQVRIKNQINAKYRENGIFLKRNRDRNYTIEEFEFHIHNDRLDSASRVILKNLIELLREVEIRSGVIERLMKKYSKKYKVIKRFKELPGVGNITAITFFSLIITPDRFPSKEKLWTYCKLGVATKESGGKIIGQQLTKRGNSLLKYVARQSAEVNITRLNNCFTHMYNRLISRGLNPSLARTTVARKIVSTMYFMWLKNVNFDPKYIN